MSEHETVHEDVKPDNEETASPEPSKEPSSVIAEARRYRKRAQAAEKTLEELKNDLAEREKTIVKHAREIERLRQREAIDAALLEAQTIDLETARLLLTQQLSNTPDENLDQSVAELRRRKPYLFRSRPRVPSAGTQSPKHAEPAPLDHALDRAASEAVATGKRGDLLRYLRLRRKT